jgi:hypothetical protein
LDYRRTVGLILDELEMSFRPAGTEPTDGQHSSGEIEAVADLALGSC